MSSIFFNLNNLHSTKYTGDELPPLPSKTYNDMSQIGEILEGEPLFPFSRNNFTIFALLHCDSKINSSQFLDEHGASQLEIFTYWKNILSAENFPIRHNLNYSDFLALVQAVEDLIFFNEKIENGAPAENIIKNINDRTVSKKTVYLPSGWHNAAGGHYATLKVVNMADEKLKMNVNILNQGAGQQFHRPLLIEDYKKKFDYCSITYNISGNFVPYYFFQQIINLQDKKILLKKYKDTAPLDENDLYALLPLCGEPVTYPLNENYIKKHAVTSQRTGTCMSTNTCTVFRDVLFSRGVSVAAFKRFQFSCKFLSLIETFKGFKKFCEQPQDINLFLKQDLGADAVFSLFHTAIHELNVGALKIYPNILDSSELLLVQQTTLLMNNYLEQKEQEYEGKKNAINLLPSVEGFIPLPATRQIGTKPFFPRQATSLHSTTQAPTSPIFSEIEIKKCPPHLMKEYLQEGVNYFVNEQKKSPYDLILCHTFMLSLPRPSGKQEDEYWDRVDEKDILEIVINLNKISKEFVLINLSISKSYQNDIHLMAYDIAAQLAPRSLILNLNNKYSFALDNIYIDNYKFCDAESYFLTKQVLRNFESRCKDKKKIFSHIVSLKSSDTYDHTKKYVMENFLTKSDKQKITLNYKPSVYSPYSDEEMLTDLLRGAFTLSNKEKKCFALHDFVSLSNLAYKSRDQYSSESVVYKTYLVCRRYSNQFFAYRAGLCSNFQNSKAHIPFCISLDTSRKYSLTPDIENSSFLPSFLKNNTSQAVLDPIGSYRKDYKKKWRKKFKDSVFPAWVDEDFRSIESSPGTQVLKSLEWAQFHIEQLNSEEIRHRIFCFLFEFGKIQKAIKKNPREFLDLFLCFQKKVIDFYIPSDNLYVIFWLNLVSNYIKSHLILSPQAEESFYSSIPKEINMRDLLIPLFEKFPEKKTKIAQHITFTYIQENLEPSNHLDLLFFQAIAKNSLEEQKSSREFPLEACERIFFSHREKLVTFFSSLSPEVQSRFGNALLESLLKTKKNYTWEQSPCKKILSDTVEGYQLNLMTAQLKKTDVKFIDASKIFKKKQLFIGSHANEAFSGMTEINVTGDKFLTISLDKKWVLEGVVFSASNSYEITNVYRTIMLNGVESQYEFISKINQDFYCPFNKKNKNWGLWENSNLHGLAESSENKGYYFDAAEERWYPIDKTSDGWTGNLGKDQLLFNLVDPSNEWETNWAKFLKKLNIDNLNNISVLAQRNGEKFQIASITFISLQLSFTPIILFGETKLKSIEFPGFYLSSEKLPSNLSKVGLIVLEKFDEIGQPIRGGLLEQKILLPALSLQKRKKSCALDPHVNVNYNEYIEGAPNYFVFFKDRKGELISNETAANLYLAIIYRSLKNFKKAKEYLDKSYKARNNTLLEWRIAYQIVNQEDLSVEGAAFDCLIGYRMLSHREKWIECPERKLDPDYEEADFIDDFNDKISKQYSFYSKNISISNGDITILPSFLRLTPSQEEALAKKNKAICSASLNTIELVDSNYIHDIRPLLENKISVRELSEKYFNEKVQESNRQDFESKSILRLYKEKNSSEENYLKNNFRSLCLQAISQNPEQRRLCKAHLFYLKKTFYGYYRWEEENSLLSFLLFVHNNYSHFNNATLSTTNKQCFEFVANKSLELKKRDLGSLPFFQENLHHPQFKKNAEKNNFLEKKASLVFPDEKVLFPNQPIEFSPHGLIKNIFKPCVSDHLLVCGMLPPERQKVTIIKIPGIEKFTPLEEHLLMNLEKAHAENSKKHLFIYELRNEKELKERLLCQKTNDTKKSSQILTDSLFLANKTPNHIENVSPDILARSLLHITSIQAKQLEKINLTDLLLFLLRKDPAVLSRKNCFLTQQQITEIKKSITQYCLLISRIHLCDQALSLLGIEGQEQELAELLQKERTYDIDAYPEFLVYEYATEKMLQPAQVKSLIWAITKIETALSGDSQQVPHLLLQFVAGGGKSSLMIPILAHRFASKDFLPVIVNTNELFEVGLETMPEHLQACFRQQMEVLSISLEYEWSEVKVEKLLKNLEEWRQAKKVLLIKAGSWHSINIARKMAYTQKDITLAKKLDLLLEYFKSKCVKLEDEGHIISNPLQQSIRCFGPKKKISLSQQILFLHFYDLLVGEKSDCELLAGMMDLKGLSRKNICAEELKKIQQSLGDKIACDELFVSLNKANLIEYLLKKDTARPEWLTSLHVSEAALAELVVCARAFIQTILPHICSLQCYKNYGSSIHPGDLSAAPKHNGEDTTAHFSNPLLKMALTIQFSWQSGIPRDKAVELLMDLQIRHFKSKNTLLVNEAQTIFNGIISGNVSLETINKQLLTKILTERPELCKNNWLIRNYLLKFALPQITIPLERITSTTAEMQAGFNRGITFSATPGVLETYPVTITADNACFDINFEAEVIFKLLHSKKPKIHLLQKAENAKEFFAELKSSDAHIDALIDRGGLLCHQNPVAVVKEYLKSSGAKESALCFDKGALVLHSKNSSLKKIDNSEMASLARKEKPFLFLDLTKTTGADVKQSFQACAGMTVGKKQTISETIQAAMRQRQLLKHQGQTIVWIMLESLYKNMQPYKAYNGDLEFSLGNLLFLMTKNEAEQSETKIVARAFQGIQSILLQYLWQAKEKSSKDGGDASQYRSWFTEETGASFYWLYEKETKEIASSTVLKEYALNYCKRLGVQWSDIPLYFTRKITTIIQQTEKFVKNISQDNSDLNIFDVMECEEKNEEELELEESSNMGSCQKAKKELYYKGDELKANFLTDPNNYCLYTFGSLNLKLPHLFVHKEFLSPFENQNSMQVTKPITTLLLQILPDSTYRFVACTALGLDFYNNQLYHLKKEKIVLPEKYALVGFDAQLQGTSWDIPEIEREKIINSFEVKKMTVYIAFLNGQIKDLAIFKQIVKEYGWSSGDYSSLCEMISQRHVSRHPLQLPELSFLHENENEPMEEINVLKRKTARSDDHDIPSASSNFGPARKLQRRNDQK